MLMLRLPLCATATAGAAVGEAVLASAAFVVILSAVCAMMVPRPAATAAKIMMLRITPHSLRKKPISPHPPQARDQSRRHMPAILAKRMSEGLTALLKPLLVLHGERSDCGAIRVRGE